MGLGNSPVILSFPASVAWIDIIEADGDLR